MLIQATRADGEMQFFDGRAELFIDRERLNSLPSPELSPPLK